MQSTSSVSNDAHRRFPGDTAMAVAMRRFDWATTSLGPPSAWPRALTTLTSLILSSKQPMFVVWGAEQTILYNDAYALLLGPKHPSALGRPFFDVWAEVRGALVDLHNRALGGESVYSEEISLLLDRQGGPKRAHFAFCYTPVHGDDGSVDGLFCACTETTGAVLAKQLADQGKRRLAIMFEQAPGFIAMLDGPEHRIDLANAAFLRLVGHRDIIGKTVAEALPDVVEQGYLDLLDKVYSTGEPFRTTGSKYDVQVDPGGPIEERFLDFIYQPIVDAEGRVSGIFVEGADVTERIQSEAALNQLNRTLEQQVQKRTALLLSQELLIRTFFDHSSECHAVLAETEDGRFRFEEANPATLALYGMTRAQVVGRTTDEVFAPGQAEELDGHLAACLRTGAPYPYERMLGEAIVESLATPVVFEAEAARRIIVSARNVTERRGLEDRLRQAQKMEAVGQLTGGLAHDFNNLLTAISGSLELLEARIAQGRIDDLGRYLHAAQGASKRAVALVHRLLAFSRRQTLDPKPTSLNRLAADMHELVRRTAGPTIDVEFVAAGGLWNTLVDSNQLENALLNLCINARDAMPQGGRLTVETNNKWLDETVAKSLELPAGQYVSLCVSDTGAGMAKDVVARAFDPFFTTKPIGEGTGLGLSMVYGFARQSGGQARIYSEIGQGTMVCLYLPRHFGDATESEPAAAAVDTPARRTGRDDPRRR